MTGCVHAWMEVSSKDLTLVGLLEPQCEGLSLLGGGSEGAAVFQVGRVGLGWAKQD